VSSTASMSDHNSMLMCVRLLLQGEEKLGGTDDVVQSVLLGGFGLGEQTVDHIFIRLRGMADKLQHGQVCCVHTHCIFACWSRVSDDKRGADYNDPGAV